MVAALQRLERCTRDRRYLQHCHYVRAKPGDSGALEF